MVNKKIMLTVALLLLGTQYKDANASQDRRFSIKSSIPSPALVVLGHSEGGKFIPSYAKPIEGNGERSLPAFLHKNNEPVEIGFVGYEIAASQQHLKDVVFVPVENIETPIAVKPGDSFSFEIFSKGSGPNTIKAVFEKNEKE